MARTGKMPFSEFRERWSDWYYLWDSTIPIIYKKKRTNNESGSGHSSRQTVVTEYLISVDSEEHNPHDNHWHFEKVWENWVGGYRTRWHVVSVKQGGVHQVTANSIKNAIRKISGGEINI
ncbi:hypothetical protein K9M41_01220 [Candidatus Gracilibacteria bacterium]|nr:hypothetical protein [Candidatus Gracilibacteria bacterium]